MSLKELVFNVPLKLRFHSLALARCYCTKSNNILESAEEHPVFVADGKDPLELERKRNKSGLQNAHRNMLFGINPYTEPMDWYHNTIRYKKRVLGRYGIRALGVPAGLVWPTPEEVEEMKDYERILYSPDIKARLQAIKEEKRKKWEAIGAKQQKIAEKMVNMQKLIASVEEKIAKKQAAEKEAILRKERKIAEIRSQLILEGNVTKEKLHEALTLAEKDEKKRKKELKKQKIMERQKRIIMELSEKHLQGENIDDKEENEDDISPRKH